MFPVYSRGPIMGARPLFLVSAMERREMIANGSAKPVHRGKAIQLLLTLEQIRGVSAQMGPSVTHKVAEGSRFHHAIRDAWTGIGKHCPLRPRMPVVLEA